MQCGRILDLPRPLECLGSSYSSLSRLPRPLNRRYGVYRPRTSFDSSNSLNLRPRPLAQFFVLQTPPGSFISSVSYSSPNRLSLISLLSSHRSRAIPTTTNPSFTLLDRFHFPAIFFARFLALTQAVSLAIPFSYPNEHSLSPSLALLVSRSLHVVVAL